jgi:ribonuclease HI
LCVAWCVAVVSDPTVAVEAEPLSPLAATADRVFARYGYDVGRAMAAIDGAVPGLGGLFDPNTDRATLAAAMEGLLSDPEPVPVENGPADGEPIPVPLAGDGPDRFALYVDGASRGNPGAAGAGAVLFDADGTRLAGVARPVGSRAGNNVAEYAALQLGLAGALERYDPTELEVRIDSMTVVRSVWGDAPPHEGCARYARAIEGALATVPSHDWVHLADADPNPADALATVGADVAALGP